MPGLGPDPECEWPIVVGVDLAPDTSAAEKGTELDPFCIVDSDACLKEGELKTGPLRTDSSGSGSLAA